jgi:hypothetical protein
VARDYYYLVATLPGLAYDEAAPMSSAAFRELCGDLLDRDDAALLDTCQLDAGLSSVGLGGGLAGGIDASSPSTFLNDWIMRERTVRTNLAEGRGANVSFGASSGGAGAVEHDSVRAEAGAKNALTMDNPLEAELYLDRERWDALDALVGVGVFSINIIYAYLLKLQLLERRALFQTEEGFAEYKALYASITEKV